jgi:CheY-like chemotaxis protein
VAASNTILIADRNSHVRTFLMREMMACGYRIKLAATGENVIKIADAPDSIDLLILDPDLPGLEARSLLASLHEKNPSLPIVLHIHPRQDGDELFSGQSCWITIIEKAGDSVERIKEVVGILLPFSARDITASKRPNYHEGELS